MDIIKQPIDSILDLHTFRPSEIKSLIPEYLNECIKEGIFEIKIVHGKGTGILKAKVHSILKRLPYVVSYRNADICEGGWGVTIVYISKYSVTKIKK